MFDDSDACVTPVLSMDEAPQHPHSVARGSFVPDAADGDEHSDDVGFTPAPAPLLSESPARSVRGLTYPSMGQHTLELLRELGYAEEDIRSFLDSGVVEEGKNAPAKGKL